MDRPTCAWTVLKILGIEKYPELLRNCPEDFEPVSVPFICEAELSKSSTMEGEMPSARQSKFWLLNLECAYDLMQMVGLHLKEFQQLQCLVVWKWERLTGPQERYLLGLALLLCHVAPSAIRTTILPRKTNKTFHKLEMSKQHLQKNGNCRSSNVWPGGSPI